MDSLQQTDIKSVFQEAADAIKDLPQHLQEKAFEMAVERISPRVVVPENKNSVVLPTDDDFFAKLAKETSISVENLKSIYKLDKTGVLKIVMPLNGKAAEKQRILAYVYLFGMRFGYEKEWITSIEFANRVKEYGANDGHISKSLAQENHDILQEGTRRGKEYSLSPNGIIKAKEILNSLISK